jgi:predicted amidohydrolase YtcJ
MADLTADLILYNANVITLEPIRPGAQLVAIHDGKILNVSTNEALKELKGIRTEVIDCRGSTILPGFNDAHCHLVALAENLLTPNTDQTTVHSISDIEAEIRNLAHHLPSGSWIRIRGYNEFYLAEKRHPTRWDLDKATTDHPVILTHHTGHAHVLNSPALALAGICGETAEPPGGMIERDLETGEPSGLLYGMSGYLANLVPPLNDNELEQGMKLANKKLVSLGITSVQDASPRNDFQRWQMLQRWKTLGRFKPRVNMMLGAEAFAQRQEPGLPGLCRSSNHLRTGAVKIILNETRGELNPPQVELNQKVLDIHRAGLQVAMHAVEETTVEAACSALEYVLRRAPRVDHRHRVEHCSVCTPELAERLALLEAVVVTQPAFIYYSGERYLNTVPTEQLRHLYPIATLINVGVKVAAGSDCPVIPPDPLSGIHAAIFRTTETGQSILHDERVSTLQALWMYTMGGAYASFEESVKGSIAPGKLADVIVLEGNLLEASAEDIKHLEIDMTIIDGEIVWERAARK